MRIYLSLIFALLSIPLIAQNVPSNGLQESKPACYALKNATILASPSKTYQNATIIIRDNKIESVGLVLKVPSDAVVIDCKGKTIVPAFIDLYSNVGLPKVEGSKPSSRRPQLESNKKGAYYWNESIHPEINAEELFTTNQKSNKALIEKGFGFALTHQFDGIARGEAAFVSLGDAEKAHIPLQQTTSVYSLQKGVSRQTYPSSQMGSIALLRQTFYDAQWHSQYGTDLNLSLNAISDQVNGNMFFVTTDRKEILRGQKIADEFDFTFSYIGSGDEYKNVNELKNIGSFIVLPVNFPKAYDVKNPYVARQIPLSDLKHWEMAPKNPGVLSRNGIPFSITSNNTKNAKEFWSNLRKAIANGLSSDQALNALTLSPASIIGMDSLVGSVEGGKYASFIIYDGNPFEKECKLMESWLMGERTVFNDLPLHDITGKYNLQLDDHRYPIEIKKNGEKYSGKITYSLKDDKTGTYVDTTTKMFVSLEKNDVTLQFIMDDAYLKGNVSLQGKVNSRMGVFEGEGLLSDGKWVKWTAIRNKKGKAKDKKDPKPTVDSTTYTWYPNMAYGFDTIPELRTTIIKNATLWTNEEAGIIENGMIIIVDGKISYAGPNKSIPGGSMRVIDAKGKHVTSGIIDEHTHIAISKGGNESGQAISAEVSIQHVINPDDINIYRQLAGGVTAAQVLHGSANPIGGQSGLIKLKWGQNAEEMLIDDAPKFIKFALVKM
jgi:imidazolonepropionase-like amidohydrolase